VRLLHRAMFFAAQAEDCFRAYSCTNVRTECAYYPSHRKLAVVNNGTRREETDVILGNGASVHVVLEPYGSNVIGV
jgi:hypothetical protein